MRHTFRAIFGGTNREVPMPSTLSKVLPPLLALSLFACKDSSGPSEQDLVDLVLAFCTEDAPTFVAMQNEGGAWTRVTPGADGRLAISATDKLGLAFAVQQGSSFSTTEVVYATRAELAPFNGAQ